MGKIRKSKKIHKTTGIKKSDSTFKKNIKKNVINNVEDDHNVADNSSLAPIEAPLIDSLKKDSDLMSVRSFKSIKNKFGIKKQISKKEKLKLKKEVLKQKVDFLMESVNSEKSSKNKKSPKNAKKSKNSKPEDAPQAKIEFVKDKDEEYLKLGNKSKGIPKRKKRQKQFSKDVDLLKNLMFKSK